MNKMISLFVCMTLILIAVAVWGSLQRNDPPAVSREDMDKQAYSTANSVSSQESSSEITVMADSPPISFRNTAVISAFFGTEASFRFRNWKLK